MMISRGILAGIAATVALSAIMLMKSAMGVMPAFNIIGDWQSAAGALGLSITSGLAWALHLALGALWGVFFAIFHSRLPGSDVKSGALLGVLAWLAMMVVFMPLAGNGLFALGLSPLVTMATLVLHIFFGAVLGYVYSILDKRGELATAI